MTLSSNILHWVFKHFLLTAEKIFRISTPSFLPTYCVNTAKRRVLSLLWKTWARINWKFHSVLLRIFALIILVAKKWILEFLIMFYLLGFGTSIFIWFLCVQYTNKCSSTSKTLTQIKEKKINPRSEWKDKNSHERAQCTNHCR